MCIIKLSESQKLHSSNRREQTTDLERKIKDMVLFGRHFLSTPHPLIFVTLFIMFKGHFNLVDYRNQAIYAEQMMIYSYAQLLIHSFQAWIWFFLFIHITISFSLILVLVWNFPTYENKCKQ